MSEELIDRNLLIQSFLAEADENLEAMEQSLIALERSPGDPDLLATIFRAAHTLKGNAATVGFDNVVEISHLAEDLLDELRAERFAVTPGLITLLLRCVDTLRTLIPATVAGGQTARRADTALLEALHAAVATGMHLETASAPAVSPSSGGMRNDVLRVSLRKLDLMLNLAGEMAIARGRLRELIAQANPARELVAAEELLDRLCNDLQEQVMGVRMVPIGPVFHQQVRAARDIARAAGKSVNVELVGEDVELDTTVVEQIRDPLMHMIRNAIDHGIELPEERVARGKPRQGKISLRASHDGGMVVVHVSDDGGGIDTKRLLERARASGLVGPNENPADEQLFPLIFTAGLSTADVVTELSGRGVGMDVVQRNITALRGTVSVDSRPGRGTTVTVRLPLTLAIIDALSVGVGEQTFVVPLDDVVECIDVTEHDLHDATAGLLDIRGQAVAFVSLGSCLGVESHAMARRNLLLVRDGERNVGVVVDRLHSRTQAVIKPLSKPLPRLPAVAGATILGNGSVAMIIDLPRLLRQQLKEAV